MWTLSWKTKNCKNHGKIKALWKRRAYCTLFHVCLFIFQSLTQEDDKKLTFKWHFLAYRDHTEKYFHLQLSPLPPLSTFVRIIANPLPPRVRRSFMVAPKSKSLFDHLLHSRFSVATFHLRFTFTCEIYNHVLRKLLLIRPASNIFNFLSLLLFPFFNTPS